MPVADTKKVASFINRLDRLNTLDELIALRDLWVQVSPSVAGTPLQGQVASVNAAIQAVIDAYNAHAAIWNGIHNAVVPTHTDNTL